MYIENRIEVKRRVKRFQIEQEELKTRTQTYL